MIAEGIHRGAVQALASGNEQSVRILFHRGAQRPQISGDGMNPITLLGAQLRGVAKANSVLSSSSENGENRNFIDNIGNPGSANVHPRNVGAFRTDVSDRFPISN